MIALCRRCLAVNPEKRPRNATKVARAVTKLLRDAEERARQAEQKEVVMRLREAEGRRRRRLLTVAGGAVVAVLVAGALSAGSQWRRAEQALVAERVQTQAAEVASAERALALVVAEANSREAVAARNGALAALRVLTQDVVRDMLASRAKLRTTDSHLLVRLPSLWSGLSSTPGDSTEALGLRAEGASALGLVRHVQGNHEDAETCYRTAAEAYMALVARHPARTECLGGLATTRTNLGTLLLERARATANDRDPVARERRTQQVAEAEAMHRQAAAFFAQSGGDVASRSDCRRALAENHRGFAVIHSDRGQAVDAEAAHQTVLRLLDEVQADGRADLLRPLEIGAECIRLGHVYRGMGRSVDACDRYAQAVSALAEIVYDPGLKLMAEEKLRQAARDNLLAAHTARAAALSAVGRHTEAVSEWNGVIELVPDGERYYYQVRRLLDWLPARLQDAARASEVVPPPQPAG